MQDSSPHTRYQQQLQKHHAHLQQLLKKRSRLGWIRLIVFLLTAFLTYKVFVAAGFVGLAVVVTGLAILLYLISKDVTNNQNIDNTKTLISINEEELQFLNNDYYSRYDGSIYIPAVHQYANDLDLFGKASLFQWMNRAYTGQGRNLVADNLLKPLTVTQIKERHEAAKEITTEIDWRQQLQAFAMQTSITAQTEAKTSAWLSEKDEHFTNPGWKIFILVYSAITLGSVVATILGYIPAGFFSSLFILYLFTSIILSRNTVKPYVQLSGIVKEIAALQQLVQWMEDKKFNASLLKQLQEEMKTGEDKAANEIRGLKIILDRFDLRSSIVGVLFFNSFLLWDARQMIALNKWRRKNKQQVAKWFSMVAEMEVLHSLATLHFNKPGWSFPEFTDVHFTLDSKEIGHPLIPEDARVNNDFDLEGTAKIGLVTGSNMAGKSTFLRSLGVNIVLAQMGAPVCAKSMLLSPVHLMSSMRIADNLAENTSTFYAELKKLKTIIEAVNRHEPVFILLDEILRGTNSMDRHKGSEALIAQLIKQKAVAVIATHDVELAKLKEQYPQSIENYHFDVQVEGEELYFDYKLKQGVCTSLNASILMKKIGIELST
jgi:hypothetical protein